MMRIFDIIFGTYGFTVEKSKYDKAKKCLAEKGIPLKREKIKGKSVTLVFDKRLEKIIRRLLIKNGIEPISEKKKGFVQFLKKYKKRPGLFVGVIILLLSVFLSKAFIWDIKVIGNERLSEEDVLSIIEKHGVYMGAFIPAINLHEIYNDILIDTDEICWISINIRGTHASVEIREADKNGSVKRPDGVYANIVASHSGVITSIESYGGHNCVSIGDTVMEGDLLVSGFYEDKTGRNVLSYPRGHIFADIIKDFVVEIPLEYKIKQYTEKEIRDISFIFFSKTINIVNNSGNSNSMYDIIEENERLSFFDCVNFPLFISVRTEIPYVMVDARRTKEQALTIAKFELSRLILDFAPSGEIISKDLIESFGSDSVIIKARIGFNADISKIKEFSLNKG